MIESVDNINKQLDLWQTTTKKSPVSHLKEKYCENEISPQYDEIDGETLPKSHPRLFRFRVTVGNRTAESTGTSKKRARKAAALQMIVELEGATLEDILLKYADTSLSVSSAETVAETVAETASTTPREDRCNPIGDLDRLAAKLFLPPPNYIQSTRCISCVSDPHKQYSHVCCITINEYSVTGESSERKKEAKRNAATQMISMLNSFYQTPSDTHSEEEGASDLSITQSTTTTDESLHQSSASISAAPPPFSTSDQSQTISHSVPPPTHPKLPSNWSELVRKAELYSEICCSGQMSAGSDESERRLRSVADVEFLDIEETTVNGLHQCLVRLLTSPITVLRGSSDSPDGARQAAARQALEYLRDNINNGLSRVSRNVTSA